MAIKDPLEELQSLQEELSQLEEGQAAEKEALENVYFNKCLPLYERRRRIVRGEVEPTAEEAGTEEAEEEEQGEGAGSKAKKAKGIPLFWLTVLKNQDTTAEYVKKRDEEALEYLEDVRCSQPKGGGIGYRVEFQFAPNPYFHEKLLVKEVQLPFVGAPLASASLKDVPPIRWKGTENNLTVRIVSKAPKKQKGGKGKKDKEASPAAMKAKPCASFFNFFSETGGPIRKKKAAGAGEEDQDEDGGDADPAVRLAQEDFELELEEGGGQVPEDHLELLMATWHEVVPNAVELYTSAGFEAPGAEAQDSDDPYAVVAPLEGGLENLPPGIRRRVRALQHLHSQQKAFRQERDRGLAKLRSDLEAAGSGIFIRRKALLLGKAQDSGDPADMAVPKFWLLALKGCPTTVELIRRRDERLLCHLADIRYRERTEGPGFHIDFEFVRQCKLWMENRVLTKTFIMVEEGGELLRTESTPIAWQEDMDVTMKTALTARGGTKTRPCSSFFQLFDQKRTALLFAGDDSVQLSAAELRDREAELAVALRDAVIPRALELFEAAKQWDHEEEDEDDEEEDYEDDEEGDEDDEPTTIRRKLKGKGKRRKEEEDTMLCCGLSRGTVFVLLLLLVASSQVFLYLDYILMQFGY